MSRKNKAPAKKEVRRRSMGQEAFGRLIRNKTAMVGLAILVIVIVLCVLAGVICPEGANAQNPTQKFIAPCKEYLLGTDNLGRSMLARVLYGGRVSIMIAFVATAISAALGIILGVIAAYYGGIVDDIIMRIMDVFSSIPNLLLAIALVVLSMNLFGDGVRDALDPRLKY